MALETLRSTINGEKLFARAAEYDSEGNHIASTKEVISNKVTALEDKVPAGTNSTDNQLVNVSGLTTAVNGVLPSGRTDGDILAGMSNSLAWDSGENIDMYLHDVFPTELIGDKTYRVVTMPDGKIWMAENLDYAWTGLTVGGTWDNSVPNAWYYDDDEILWGYHGRRCGLLYNVAALNQLINGAVTISGWHVPSNEEWDALARAVGGVYDGNNYTIAGMHLKSTDKGWFTGFGGDNIYGFRALPAGQRQASGWFNIGVTGNFWSSSTYSNYRWLRYVTKDNNVLYDGRTSFFSEAGSIRLIKNAT